MSWPTGHTISPGYVSIRFLIPNDRWLIESLTGSMLGLLTPFSWDAVGDIDPRIAAAVFRFVWNSQQVQNTMVGQIVCFPADNMQFIQQDPANGPSQFRKCDGAYYAKADFPDLYACIGDTFGSTSLDFAIPDLRGRAIIDAGSGPGLTTRALGAVVGEENHTLTALEMPAHQHTEITAITALINGGLEAPAAAAIPGAGLTGSAGGGAAHNNMQPSMALFYYVQVTP